MGDFTSCVGSRGDREADVECTDVECTDVEVEVGVSASRALVRAHSVAEESGECGVSSKEAPFEERVADLEEFFSQQIVQAEGDLEELGRFPTNPVLRDRIRLRYSNVLGEMGGWYKFLRGGSMFIFDIDRDERTAVAYARMMRLQDIVETAETAVTKLKERERLLSFLREMEASRGVRDVLSGHQDMRLHRLEERMEIQEMDLLDSDFDLFS